MANIKSTDTEIAVGSMTGQRIYKTYNGSYFSVCKCGKQTAVVALRSQAEQDASDHWTTKPYCDKAS